MPLDLAQKRVVRSVGKVAGLITGTVLAVMLIITVVFNAFPLSFFTVYGNSMQPYFNNGDVGVLVESSELKKGEIVFFRRPDSWESKQSHNVLVKRIAGLEGDSLSYSNGTFKVNGKTVFSPESTSCARTEPYDYVLKEGEFLALGDNQQNSIDSRARFCAGEEDFLVSVDSVEKSGTILFHL